MKNQSFGVHYTNEQHGAPVCVIGIPVAREERLLDKHEAQGPVIIPDVWRMP